MYSDGNQNYSIKKTKKHIPFQMGKWKWKWRSQTQLYILIRSNSLSTIFFPSGTTYNVRLTIAGIHEKTKTLEQNSIKSFGLNRHREVLKVIPISVVKWVCPRSCSTFPAVCSTDLGVSFSYICVLKYPFGRVSTCLYQLALRNKGNEKKWHP